MVMAQARKRLACHRPRLFAGCLPLPARHSHTLQHPPARLPWHRPPSPQDVSSTEAAIIYTLEPVFGAGLAYVMLGERWGTSGWVGAGLIIVACLIAQAS